MHIAHAGLNRTKKLASQSFYWPGMNSDIKTMIDRCEQCQRLRPSQAPEPIIILPAAKEPMSDISLDLFHAPSGEFLILIDRFSGFPMVAKLHSLDTSSIIKHLLTRFHDWGFPTHITSDGGPQFRSEFTQFCVSNFITHTKSSAYHQQSNGLAEAGVKNVKYLL